MRATTRAAVTKPKSKQRSLASRYGLPKSPGDKDATFLVFVLSGLAASLLGIALARATNLTLALVLGLVFLVAWAPVAIRAMKTPMRVALTLLSAAAVVPFGVQFGLGVSSDDLPVLAGVIMALLILRRRLLTARIPWGVLLVAAFAAWVVITSTVNRLGLAESVQAIGRWSLVALLILVALAMTRERSERDFLFRSIVVVGLLEALFGIWAYGAAWTSPTGKIGLQLFNYYQPLYRVEPGRIAGTLNLSPDFFGAFLLVPMFLAASYAMRTASIRAQFTWWAAWLILGWGVVWSYSRGAQLAVLIGTVLFVFLIRSPRPLIAVGVLVALASLFTPAMTRWIEEGNNRLTLARQSLLIAGDNLGTGLGAGQYLDRGVLPDEDRGVLPDEDMSQPGANPEQGATTSGEEEASDQRVIWTPHNSFLLALAETGVVGGILFFVMVVTAGIANLGLSLVRDGPRGERVTSAGIVSAMFALGALTFTANVFHIPPVATYYWVAGAAGVNILADHGDRIASWYAGRKRSPDTDPS